MEKYYYSYSEFLEDVKTLVEKCKDFNCEAILGISRGGLTLSHFMGEAMGIRKVYTINSIGYKNRSKLDEISVSNVPDLNEESKVLIVDDIVDSGETMQKVLEILKEKYPNIQFKTVAIFYKSVAAITADFAIKEAKTWIDFFWEVDTLN